MKRLDFNSGWQFHKKGYTNSVAVTLPHDAMIHEKREADGPGGSGHGYFPGGVYVYEKTFTAPADWADKTVSLLFEGVYKNATVTVNGKEAGAGPTAMSPSPSAWTGCWTTAERTLSLSRRTTPSCPTPDGTPARASTARCPCWWVKRPTSNGRA